MGMYSSAFFIDQGLLSKEGVGLLYGLVTGGFLHISTTIFFESSPHHKFQMNKLLVTFFCCRIGDCIGIFDVIFIFQQSQFILPFFPGEALKN